VRGRVSRKPAKLRYVIRWSRLARHDSSLPDEVQHARRVRSVSVCVHIRAEELARLHLRPGFLEELAPEAVERVLALVEETAERVPETGIRIVRSAREQHASCVVDDEC